VNAAFRLETATKQIGLDIAMGDTTYQHLVSHIGELKFFERYNVDLKGYDSPTPTHACSFTDLDRFLKNNFDTFH
jgi:adenylate cyclase